MQLCAQSNTKPAPIVGQPCPDFKFVEVANYSKKSVSLDDLKGQYFILDFWAKTCGTCVASMPKVNRIQQTYKDKIQIIFSGQDDKEGEMRKIYAVIKEKYKMIVPCAYDKEVIMQFNTGRVVPLLVWVDKVGIVQAVTTNDDLNEENVNKFITGQSFGHSDYTYNGRLISDQKLKEKKERLFAVDEKDKLDFLFRSTLLRCIHYDGDYGGLGEIDENPIKGNQKQISLIRSPVRTLYRIAYWGTGPMTKDKQVLVELKDSSEVYNADGSNEIEYCYSLQAPKNRASKEELMGMMQNDLNNYFGYQATFEDRTLPCYELIIIDKVKAKQLLSQENGDGSGNWARRVGGKIKNSTMQNFCNLLEMDLPLNIILVDKTGIKGKINIEFKNASLVELNGMRKALQRNGMDLIPGTTIINILVLKDRKPKLNSL